jgi:hypothetical protein
MRSSRQSRALNGLHDIDWASLQHAYGDASDTPRHIERLLAASRRTRTNALRALSHSVYHQSGGYSASPHALRFVVELLAVPDIDQKSGLLRLACHLGIVVGPRPFIATGYTDPVPWLERWFGSDQSTSLAWFVECRRIFEAATGLLVGLLEDGSAAVRAQSAFAVAWLPARRDEIVPALEARFGVERNAKVRAAILIALGLLSQSMNEADRERLRDWLSTRRRSPADTVVGAGQAIAALYLSDDMPEPALDAALGEIIVSEPDLYPFPWFGGNLSKLAVDVYAARARAREWPVAASFLAMFLRVLDGRSGSDELAPRLACALVESSFDSKRTADAPLSAPQRSALEAILRAATVFGRPGRSIEETLGAHALPQDVASLARLVGWLQVAEPEPPRLVDQLPADRARRVVGPLLESTSIDLRQMLCRCYPFDRALLDSVHDLVDWEIVSDNRALCVDDDLLAAFMGRWSAWRFGINPAVCWTPERIERFREQLSWPALSTRTDIAWTPALLEQHADRWDWDKLSANCGLPWSEELIDRYQDHWSWHRLSHNPALPWSEPLLRRYRRWDWSRLSGNGGLPWSEAFFRRHRRKWDWCQLCKASGFPWTEEFLEQNVERLECWGNLSGNIGLPWSAELIARYEARWNWDMLSRNPALPWSPELVLRFEERWKWNELVFNRAVPWQDDVVLERFARHAAAASSWWFRYGDHALPWSDAQIADPRLSHLWCAEDRTLYARFLAPIFDHELVRHVLQRAVVTEAETALEQALDLRRHAPALGVDDPLLDALHVGRPLRLLRGMRDDPRLMLRDAAARMLARAPWVSG